MTGKSRWWLTAIVTGLLLTSGCAATGTEVNLGQEFQLAPGQSAAVKGEDLAIRFTAVTADSRCPRGAVCIRAGEAQSEVEISHLGVTYPLTLTQPGLSEPPGTGFKDYEITFNLLPYPGVGEEIKDSDYRLQLTISRKPV